MQPDSDGLILSTTDTPSHMAFKLQPGVEYITHEVGQYEAGIQS